MDQKFYKPSYEFIYYDHYFDDSVLFRYDEKECQNIRVPAAHHLTFSKIISFIARKNTSKGQQDLTDFCDLTNHRTFSLGHFLAYTVRVHADQHIRNFFAQTRLSKDERELLSSSSVFRVQAILPLKSVNAETPSEQHRLITGNMEALLSNFAAEVSTTAKFKEITSVQAVTHTGEVSIRALAKVLDKITIPAERVRVLLRTRDYEDYFRSTSITRTVEDIKDFRYSFKFYSAPPFIQGFLVRYMDGSYDHIYSFYLHTRSGRTQIDHTVHFESGRSGGTFHRIFDSWFEYHWGKTNNNYHTLVFDFDDTIADTAFIQIEAWEEALTNLPAHRRNLLSHEFTEAMERGNLIGLIKRSFTDLQTARRMAESMFSNDLSEDTKEAAIKELQEARLKIRTRRTKGAHLFPGVDKMIPLLANSFYLAIVSATDEKVIRDYLRNKGLLEYFGYVYGKHAPYDSWSEHIAIKTQNLIKMSTILGIPLSRVIYIGDSDGDFVASSQIGVAFIEARLEKGNLGSASLVRADAQPVFFSNYEDIFDSIGLIEEARAT